MEELNTREVLYGRLATTDAGWLGDSQGLSEMEIVFSTCRSARAMLILVWCRSLLPCGLDIKPGCPVSPAAEPQSRR